MVSSALQLYEYSNVSLIRGSYITDMKRQAYSREMGTPGKLKEGGCSANCGIRTRSNTLYGERVPLRVPHKASSQIWAIWLCPASRSRPHAAPALRQLHCFLVVAASHSICPDTAFAAFPVFLGHISSVACSKRSTVADFS